MTRGTDHPSASPRRLARIRIALLLLLTCCLTQGAYAWSHLGHRMICAIALMQLDAADRAEVERLAGRFRTPDGRGYRYFSQGCTFADEARGKARSDAMQWRTFADYDRWHYINAPRSARELTRAHCNADCVVHGIEHNFRIFSNHDVDEAARARAMLMMSHFIGDAHQPLHTGFADDRGGNRIAIRPGGFYSQSNLHAVWDSGILAAALDGQEWWAFATRLNDAIGARERSIWRASPPLEWARESFSLATDARTGYCRNSGNGECQPIPGARSLDRGYQQQVQAIALERIQRAGTRLAVYLSRALER